MGIAEPQGRMDLSFGLVKRALMKTPYICDAQGGGQKGS